MYLAIEINVDATSIQDFNDKVLRGGSTKPEQVVNQLINYLQGVQLGQYPGTVQLTSKNASSSISTSGSGSTQITLSMA